MSGTFLVVGAGPTGLGCARALIEHGDVVVVERIPVTGGTAGWDDRDVVRSTRELRAAGADFALGETALRWNGRELLLAGPGRFRSLAGRHLFFAGGLRPATLADLRVDGDRPAGVVPATVAEHLLQAGVKLWNRVVVIGDGPWARTVAHECRDLGTRVIAVADLTASSTPWADEHHDRPAGLTISGGSRVEGVRLRNPTGDVTIACDAVVLAADPRPNRNVEGALLEGSTGVTFLQDVAPTGFPDRFLAGRAAARLWLTENGVPA